MPDSSKNVAVFIGRFAPFHKGHLQTIRQLILDEQIDRVVCVLGSSDKLDLRNPWTPAVRELMIRDSLSPDENKKLGTVSLKDFGNDDIWTDNLVRLVREETTGHFKSRTNLSFTLYGVGKDASTSQYLLQIEKILLDTQTNWQYKALPTVYQTKDGEVMHATDLRDAAMTFFMHGSPSAKAQLLDALPRPVSQKMLAQAYRSDVISLILYQTSVSFWLKNTSLLLSVLLATKGEQAAESEEKLSLDIYRSFSF